MSEYHVIEELPLIILYEICAGVERVAQPEGDAQLNINKTGDCFVCSSFAIIRHFCRQANIEPPSMADLYHKVWADKEIGAAKGSHYWAIEKFWPRWQHMLDWWKIELSAETDPPFEFNEYYSHNIYGPNLYTSTALVKRVRTYLEAGYLIHVEMSSKPASEYRKEGYTPCGADHMAVIDGFRTSSKQQLSCSGPGYGAHWSGTTLYQLHIVDSSRKKSEPYWIDIDTWMKEHGGASMWFIRPKREKHYSFPESKDCPLGHKRKSDC